MLVFVILTCCCRGDSSDLIHVNLRVMNYILDSRRTFRHNTTKICTQIEKIFDSHLSKKSR